MKGFNLAVRALLIAAAVAVTAVGTVFAQSSQSPQNRKPTAAVYIKGNPDGRDFIKKAVYNYLIKTGKYTVINIDAIDIALKELQRQDNIATVQIAKYGKDAGAEWVCVVEITEYKGDTYVNTSMVDTETKEAPYSEMQPLPRGKDILDFVKQLIGGMLAMEVKGGDARVR